MRVDVVTLFPELFERFAEVSFVGRAITGGQLSLRLRSPRDFGLGKHRSVDDTPYGGGSGMLHRVTGAGRRASSAPAASSPSGYGNRGA